MKVHLIKRQPIEAYAKKHQSESPFNELLSKIKEADWNKPMDMKATFNSADLLGKGCDRVVFNVGGNNHRLICKYYFGKKQVHLFVCWLGTHIEYDKLNAKHEQYTVTLKG
ncbi:MAG TPA: type II toxin-antitoxin system HigB family toxin [Bacteroidia bacterium]|nr:type II toxin-antitoxin system HigB family toxin [Bacteroidia bacterium]